MESEPLRIPLHRARRSSYPASEGPLENELAVARLKLARWLSLHLLRNASRHGGAVPLKH
jgi:hypothetical protein